MGYLPELEHLHLVEEEGEEEGMGLVEVDSRHTQGGGVYLVMVGLSQASAGRPRHQGPRLTCRASQCRVPSAA